MEGKGGGLWSGWLVDGFSIDIEAASGELVDNWILKANLSYANQARIIDF